MCSFVFSLNKNNFFINSGYLHNVDIAVIKEQFSKSP